MAYVWHPQASTLPTVNENLMACLREFSLWMRELGTYKASVDNTLQVEEPLWSSISDISAY